jgi:hypothetical protein
MAIAGVHCHGPRCELFHEVGLLTATVDSEPFTPALDSIDVSSKHPPEVGV